MFHVKHGGGVSLLDFVGDLLSGGEMMEALLGIVGNIWTQMETLVTTITGNPVLLFPVAFVFAFSVVRLAKSLLGLRSGRRR